MKKKVAVSPAVKSASKKKKPNNNQTPSDSRKSKNIRIGFLALFTLIVLLLIAKTISFLTSLEEPLSNINSKNLYTWNEQSTINILLIPENASVDQTLSILSYSPIDKRVVLLHASENTHVELPESFGWRKLGEIYRLGQLQTPQIGVSLLKRSLTRLVGLPMDGVIVLNEKDSKKTSEEWVNELRQNRFKALSLNSDIQSDLTPKELYKLFWELSEVREDKIESLDLTRSNITESKLLTDRTRVLGVDTIKLDLFIRENMADAEILQEGTSVAILNATDYPGLAQEASRIVTNMGGQVTITISADQQVEKSLIVVNPEIKLDKENITQNRLAQIFAPWCLKEECVSLDSKVINSRADITIVLGSDFVQQLFDQP